MAAVKPFSRYFTFKTHLLSAPFIVLCFPFKPLPTTTFTTTVHEKAKEFSFIFSLTLHRKCKWHNFPFSTECDLFWFSLILIFNDTFYRLSICPIKASKGIAFHGRFVEQQTMVFSSRHFAFSLQLTPPLCVRKAPLLDLENCNLQMRSISRAKKKREFVNQSHYFCFDSTRLRWWWVRRSKMCVWVSIEEHYFIAWAFEKSSLPCVCVENNGSSFPSFFFAAAFLARRRRNITTEK